MVKVVMVLVIILAAWHLTTSLRGNQRRSGDPESFDKREEAHGRDPHDGRDGVGKEPSKGEGGDEGVLTRDIDEENGNMPPQIDKDKSDTPRIYEENGDIEEGDNTPLILLWNNYQGDKSALYNKIFHR